MLAAFLEAALRSLLLAIAVWAGLGAFRIRNVLAQKRAWAVVLAGAWLMPVALLLTAQWHGLPAASLRIPARFARIQAALAPASQPAASTVTLASQSRGPASLSASSTSVAAPSAQQPLTFAPLAVVSMTQPVNLNLAPVAVRQPSPGHASVSMATIALLAYLIVAGALLFRLLRGLAATFRLWRTAEPVAGLPFDVSVRVSRNISSPVTVGAGIILPACYAQWGDEKLRIVLAHERSHVLEHDFQLQILATLYAALFWFSPLGWWLKRKLSDLGEAISDRSSLEHAESRSSYAQILLEFAAAPRPTLIGVAMARPSSISRRIELLLNENALRQAFAGSRRTRIAVLIVPVALFAVFSLVRVQAAAIAPEQIAPELRHAEPKTQPTVSARTVMLAASSSSPLEMGIANPAVPAAPGASAAPVDPPTPPPPPAFVQNAAAQTEATFDRNLTFNGKLALLVSTGSGNITFTSGPANQIHVHGTVKVNHDGDPAQVQQIAANPPIEQEGNKITIGGHQENLHNISISYEIEAPADTELIAATGSGNISDTGMGHDAKLTTGSGNITATGIEGGFRTQTGSGNISIDGTGQGDAKAQTGSGNIELKGVHGSLQAQTGSGRIKAAGTPSSPWKLQTGSGSIELATGNAPMNLDLSTGSGKISTEHPMALQTSEDKHHITGQLNGGGPEVKIQTGSGDIQIQ